MRFPFPYYVDSSHSLFPYFTTVSASARHMSLISLKYLWQVYTAFQWDEPLSKLQKAILKEIEDALPEMNRRRKENTKEYVMPSKQRPVMPSRFLTSFFTVTKNKDYYADGLPSTVAANTVRSNCEYMAKWAKSAQDPDNGVLTSPFLVDSSKEDDPGVAVFSSHYCRLTEDHQLTFPKTDKRLLLEPMLPDSAQITQVRVYPKAFSFTVEVICECIGRIPQREPNLCLFNRELPLDELINAVFHDLTERGADNE